MAEPSTRIETDYLVIGSGAMGMAFTDVMVTETDARIVMVDRHARPGGHWNDAYPFVRLHQPSSFYGVNSRKLGMDTIDQTGWNQGLYELASGTEVVTYFDDVMRQQFLPSGRVQYFPMCEYEGDNRFSSLVSGARLEVDVAAKVVDATYMNVTVPSMTTPSYEVGEGVRCVPLNELARLDAPAHDYVVVGGGKTAMDACLYLLENGVGPDRIMWIRPRDSWILDRASFQPGTSGVASVELMAVQMESIAASTSTPDLFERLEAAGALYRLGPDVTPTMYRCATVSQAELSALRRITNVVRLGRVLSIEVDRIVLAEGTIPTNLTTLHVDCTSDGLAQRPVVPIFDGNRLTLQTVRSCQQVFSAAFIAHVEANRHGDHIGDVDMNEICTVVPHPNTDIDWLRVQAANMANAARWSRDPELRTWLAEARLDAAASLRSGIGPEATDAYDALIQRIRAAGPDALANLHRFVAADPVR